MRLQADFSMGSKTLEADFGTFQNASDGGYERGLQEGRQAEYDRFWDAYQDHGNRPGLFRGSCWDDETFKPKYDIRPIGDASDIFNNCNITDLKGILEQLGVVLDFSQVTACGRGFQQADVTRLPVLDFSNIQSSGAIFQYCFDLFSVDKIISNSNFTADFRFCYALEHVRFEGVICQPPLLQHSEKLTNESVQSVIDHLKDLTGQATQTLTFHKNVGNRLTAAQKATLTAKNWTLVY